MRFITFTKLIWLFILCTAIEGAAQIPIQLEEHIQAERDRGKHDHL